MSVFYKITGILLYVVFGISIIVMLFFYLGERFIDESAYNQKIAKIEAPEEPVYESPQTPTIADSLASDSTTAEAVQPVPVAKPQAPAASTVSLSFLEKLVYYKTDLALMWAYILGAVTILLALVFPLFFMFTSLKNLLRTLGVLVGVAVLVGLAYMLSSDVPLSIPGFQGTDNSNPSVLKLVDTGIFLVYFLLGLALLSILLSEVVKVFK